MLPADLGKHKPTRISWAKTQWVGIAARRRSKTFTRNIPRFIALHKHRLRMTTSPPPPPLNLIAGRITVKQLFTAGFLWNTVWSRSREQCLMRAYFRSKTTPSRFPVFCASVFYICSLYSPVDSSANRGQSYGIRSLLQGKRISCSVWDNLAQVTLGWNNCNDLVSHQVTGKPRSVCSKETREYSSFSLSWFLWLRLIQQPPCLLLPSECCYFLPAPVKKNNKNEI